MFIYEKNAIKIYYYKTLLKIDENEATIYFSNYILKVNGSGLKIDYFEKEELHIKGIIASINFDYAR